MRAAEINRTGNNRVVVPSVWGDFRMRLQHRTATGQWDIKILTPQAMHGLAGVDGVAIKESYASINTLENHLAGILIHPGDVIPPPPPAEDAAVVTFQPLTDRQQLAGHQLVRGMRRAFMRRKLASGGRRRADPGIGSPTRATRVSVYPSRPTHPLDSDAKSGFVVAHLALILVPTSFESAPHPFTLDSLISEPWSATRDTLRAIAVSAAAQFQADTNEGDACHSALRSLPTHRGPPQANTDARAWKIDIDDSILPLRAPDPRGTLARARGRSESQLPAAMRPHCRHMAAQRSVGVFDVFRDAAFTDYLEASSSPVSSKTAATSRPFASNPSWVLAW